MGLEHQAAAGAEDVGEDRQPDRTLVVGGGMHDRPVAHELDAEHGRLVQVRVEHDGIGRALRDRVEQLGAARPLVTDPRERIRTGCTRRHREESLRPALEVTGRGAEVGKRETCTPRSTA